tara:strand:+ start:52 stop:471 length:420 start_codon:yes stop_codon:yes gene_type:complete
MPGIEIKGTSPIANYRHGGRIGHNKGGRVGLKSGGRSRKFGGGRTNLLEELGRVEAEPSNRNRRAEIGRVHGELNRGYKTGGRVGLKKGGDKNWIQDVNKSIKARGTKGKCTPITKPGCTGKAKALAKTFKKMAKKRKS